MDRVTDGGQQRSFSIRDGIVLVGLSVVATYLLRVQQSFQLVPSWRSEASTGYHEENLRMRALKKLPVLLVADIESDGKNEILLATKDPSLMLFKPMKQPPGLKALPYLKTMAEFSLLSGEGDSMHDRRQPVAMATGYLEPLLSDDQVRQQVNVVLCADWTVVCLGSDFKLRWTTRLSNVSWNPQHVISEAAILILPHALEPGDGGLVIVGGRVTDSSHQTLRHRHSHEHEEPGSESAKQGSKPGQDVGHFSTFAISGRHGDIRWHHLPGDFEEEGNTDEELFKGVHFKLNLKKGWAHRGEIGWHQYSEAIIKQMPFRWQSSSDTRFEIADFKKNGIGHTAQDEDDTLSVSSFLASSFEEHIAGHHFGGLPPHSASEHIKNPNAVIIHSREGLEVLVLKSGRPLTRLLLSAGSSYADINKDGIIDVAQDQFTYPGDEHNCLAVVKSRLPPDSLLFNGSICYPSSLFAAMSYPWAYVTGNTDVKENQDLSLLPLVVTSIAKRRGIVSHLLGLSMIKPGMDTIFSVSNGRVTSYGPNGQFNWQVSTSAFWSEHYIVTKVKGQVDHDLQDMYHTAFVPSIRVLSLKEFGKKSAAVLAGWDSIVLLSLETGNVLAEHTLPCQPTAPISVGDFDDDGWNDFMVQCSHSYLGFSVQQYTGYWTTAFIGLAVVVIVTALVATCTPEEKPIEGTAPGHGLER